MEKEEDLLEDPASGEEDLFDLNLDDLSPDDLDQELQQEESDEEIIELMDLIEDEDEDFEPGDGEPSILSEEVEPTGEPTGSQGPDEALEELEKNLDISDLSIESDLDIEEGIGTEDLTGEEDIVGNDLEKMLAEESDQELDITLDDSAEPEKSLEELIEDTQPVKPVRDEITTSEKGISEEIVSGDELKEMSGKEPEEDEDLTVVSPISSGDVIGAGDEAALKEPEPSVDTGSSQEAQGEVSRPLQDTGGETEMIRISEERIEAIIVKVVEDVLERVVRETVANAAEKVISEAIEALKLSIEPVSD